MLSRRKNKTLLSPEIVVSEIKLTVEQTFGNEMLSAMESCFDNVYKISFKDNSIFDYPDKFAEALLYAFGEGREVMLKIINERLAKLASFKDLEELTESDAYAYVFLINLIKGKIVHSAA